MMFVVCVIHRICQQIYEIKKYVFVIIFQKENGNTFTLFIIFVVKSLQKEQNSTNLLLWPPICRNKSAITPKWFNSLDTNSSFEAIIGKSTNRLNYFHSYIPKTFIRPQYSDIRPLNFVKTSAFWFEINVMNQYWRL